MIPFEWRAAIQTAVIGFGFKFIFAVLWHYIYPRENTLTVRAVRLRLRSRGSISVTSLFFAPSTSWPQLSAVARLLASGQRCHLSSSLQIVVIVLCSWPVPLWQAFPHCRAAWQQLCPCLSQCSEMASYLCHGGDPHKWIGSGYLDSHYLKSASGDKNYKLVTLDFCEV